MPKLKFDQYLILLLILGALLASIVIPVVWIRNSDVILEKSTVTMDLLKWAGDLLKIIISFYLGSILWQSYQRQRTKETLTSLINAIREQCRIAARLLRLMKDIEIMDQDKYEIQSKALIKGYFYIRNELRLIEERYVGEVDENHLEWIFFYNEIKSDYETIIRALERREGLLPRSKPSKKLVDSIDRVLEWLEKCPSDIRK